MNDWDDDGEVESNWAIRLEFCVLALLFVGSLGYAVMAMI